MMKIAFPLFEVIVGVAFAYAGALLIALMPSLITFATGVLVLWCGIFTAIKGITDGVKVLTE